jgi:hypothetical protein
VLRRYLLGWNKVWNLLLLLLLLLLLMLMLLVVVDFLLPLALRI